MTDELRDLIDRYLDEDLNSDEMARLEGVLMEDENTRDSFVRYCRLHTDVRFSIRAERVSTKVIANLETIEPKRVHWRPFLALAASVLVIGFGIWQWGEPREIPSDELAWLVNAQNCRWSEGMEPNGPMRVGSTLRIERGLAEIKFRSGATVVVEGPAGLEFLTENRARLLRGRLTAKVPEAAKGFTILSPHGKVIDLGTEFGISVADDGETRVEVFEGEVDAMSGELTKRLTKQDAVQLNDTAILQLQAKPELFTRAIIPPPVIVPKTKTVTFRDVVPDTLPDVEGRGIGFTHRLPGTGKALLLHDKNLRLNSEEGWLELMTTDSDINRQFGMTTGEYFGVRLSDYGFTGKEDFVVSAVFPNFPPLHAINQFGLYAGTKSDRNTRGGVFSHRPNEYTLNIVNNNGGDDKNSHFVGIATPGDSLRITLRRQKNQYSMTVENLTTNATTTLTTKHPEFLDAERDLFVGLFGANTRSKESKRLFVSEFSVTVWTIADTR